MTAPIRVLLVDDHALLRAGFRTILDTQTDIAVVGEASSGPRRWRRPRPCIPTSS